MKILLFLLLPLWGQPLGAQLYVNQQYHFDFKVQSDFDGGVCVQGDTVYCVGHSIDSTGYLSLLLAMFDRKGTLIRYRTYNLLDDPSGPRTFYSFTPPRYVGGGRLEDFCSISYRNPTRMTFHTWQDSMSFDTFPHIYAPYDDFTAINDWRPTPDSGYIVVYNVRSTQLSDANAGVAAARLDKNLNVLWQKLYHFPYTEGVNSVWPAQDGGFFIGGYNNNFFTPQSYKSRIFVIKTDASGEVMWTYQSPQTEMKILVTGLRETDDGGVIGITHRAKEVGAVGGVVHTYPVFFKLNAQHQLAWERPMGNGKYALLSYLFDFTEANEGDGYVAAGSMTWFDDVTGWIAKTGTNGDSLWVRSHRILHDSVYLAWHEIDAIVKDPTGEGYWLAGYTDNHDGNMPPPPPRVRAWLLHTDNWGCLVPGCQLPVGSTEASGQPPQVLLYPNPARDYLALHIPPDARLPSGQVSIWSEDGRRAFQSRFDQSATEYVIFLDKIPAGKYVLRVENERGDVVVGKVFVRL